MTRDAALLLLGHGSTLNADSSAPTYQHAEELRRRHAFADVQVAFWKEEPNFRQALRQIRQSKIYVVPNFISSGYFTEQVIPRELALDGAITQREGREIYYCAPVGLNPVMTDVLLRRAHEVVAQSPVEIADPATTACLFICGHGTSLNDNSTKIIHDQVEIIRSRKIYADCQAVLMEQRPFVKDWRQLTSCSDVIVVPFFISDGLHSFEDIPVLLGMPPQTPETMREDPHREPGRRLWYANAIGTEPSMADAILAQVQEFDVAHGLSSADILPNEADVCFPPLVDLSQKHPAWSLGEVSVRRENKHCFLLTHRDDFAGDPQTLRQIDFTGLREVIRVGRDGRFRPLRACPNLRRGWMMRLWGCEGLQAALDYLYPAEVANWALWKAGELPVTAWPETAARQTGRFRVVRELGEAGVSELTAQVCDRECLKRRLWSPAQQPVDPRNAELPLLCPEACNYFVGKAREKLKGPEQEEA